MPINYRRYDIYLFEEDAMDAQSPPAPPITESSKTLSDVGSDVTHDVPLPAESTPPSIRIRQARMFGREMLTLAAVAGLLTVFSTPVFAGDDRKDKKEWHERQQGSHPQAMRPHGKKSPPTWVNGMMERHSHHEDHPNRSAAEAKHWQDKRMWRQADSWPGAKDWSNARAKNWKSESRRWPQRGGYGGGFITQEAYAQHYTVKHPFRVGKEPEMKNGYAHFKHEGDHFVIVDPYPEHWDAKWHETDDVFLEYDQGYYLHSRKHPGSPLAVIVLE